MRRFRLAVAALVPILLLASSGCDIAMADLREQQTADWRKSYDLQPGGHVGISNVNGKIDVQPSDGSRVEIIAEKSARGASADAARQALNRIEIQESASASDVRIETRLQRGGMFDGGNLSVHYTVRVPLDADLKVVTVNGGVDVTGLSGRIAAEATNGGVKGHAISGSIDASTTNGGVEVDLAKVDERGVKLECTNGGIHLRLPADARATIEARITNGGISTTGLALESSGDESRRRLDARLNGGGPRVHLEGTNGGIQITSR